MLPAKFGSILPSSFRGEDFFKQQPITNKHWPWRPYLLVERNEMEKIYRGPYIDAYCQVLFHLAKLFPRRRLKYEKVNRQKTDAKWWQYLTWLFGSGELKNYEKRAITPGRLLHNCRACWSWQAEHVFSLHLTSIFYSFWNKGWKVLKENFVKKIMFICFSWYINMDVYMYISVLLCWIREYNRF